MQIKLRLYLILFAFFLFLIDSIFVLTNSTQISFLILVLILFGVPHGALDLYIDQHLHKSDSNQKIFLLKYIGNIVAYALVWYFFPIAALVIFILITAYHFGEIDWLGKTDNIIHKQPIQSLGYYGFYYYFLKISILLYRFLLGWNALRLMKVNGCNWQIKFIQLPLLDYLPFMLFYFFLRGYFFQIISIITIL